MGFYHIILQLKTKQEGKRDYDEQQHKNTFHFPEAYWHGQGTGARKEEEA